MTGRVIRFAAMLAVVIGSGALAVSSARAAADFSIQSQPVKDPAYVGEFVNFNITVSNAGPDAERSSIDGVLGTGIGFDSMLQGCTQTEPEPGVVGFHCEYRSIQPGGSSTKTIILKGEQPGTRVIETVVKSASDPEPANNVAQSAWTLLPTADLGVLQTASAGRVLAGEELAYDILPRNYGPNPTDDAIVIDRLPPQVSFVSASPPCSHADGIVRCPVDRLVQGIPYGLRIVVRAHSSGVAVNDVSISSSAGDFALYNNASSVRTEVRPSADLRISQADFPDPLTHGGLLTYAIALHNAGPTAAEQVVVRDVLPTGMTFSRSLECYPQGGTVDCALGTVAPGETRRIEIATVAAAGGLNSVEALSPTHDPDPSNQSSVEPTTVTPPSRCMGIAATIVGTERADLLKGTPRRDVVVGLAGNDRILGLGGNDVICGDAGRDRLLGGRGKDELLGGRGKDTLRGGPGRDRLVGGRGRDLQRQ